MDNNVQGITVTTEATDDPLQHPSLHTFSLFVFSYS